MTAEGVITLEPQNGAEVVALRHWEQENKIESDQDEAAHQWRGAAIEIIRRD
jgi:hypothetical protein